MMGVAAAVAATFGKHAFAPDHISENCQAHGPEEDEPQNHGGDPRPLAPFVQPSFCLGGPGGYGAHVFLHTGYVNVLHIE